MAEYIEREALLNRLKTKVKRITPIEKSRDMFYHDSGVNGALTRAMLEAENAPAADVVPVVRGRWEVHPKDTHASLKHLEKLRCTHCWHFFYHDCGDSKNYCPNCGARMEGE